MTTTAKAASTLAVAASGLVFSQRFSAAEGCPVKGEADQGGCPVKKKDGYIAPQQYDVYSRPIDPRNNMPSTAIQSSAPGQRIELSKDRVVSTIPKAGTDDANWQYPSPQMFWNSLVRKGKAGGATEEDMATVVAVHNNMNETTWNKVLEWEKLRDSREETAAYQPRLSRFTGRPDELSLEARIRSTLFGWPAPFDRHDWIVDRGGQEVRYVIDYYSDESRASSDTVPSGLSDKSAVKSILLDVRPALDSFDAFLDRAFRMPYLRFKGEVPQGLPLFADRSMTPQPAKKETAAITDSVEDTVTARVTKTCSDRFAALRDCGTDDKKCADAAIALQHCVATIVCPSEAKAFQVAAVSKDKAQAEQAYAAMDAALDQFAQKSAATRQAG